jgi:hypothetical protein
MHINIIELFSGKFEPKALGRATESFESSYLQIRGKTGSIQGVVAGVVCKTVTVQRVSWLDAQNSSLYRLFVKKIPVVIPVAVKPSI